MDAEIGGHRPVVDCPGCCQSGGVLACCNDAVLQTGRRLLIDDPDRLTGVKVLGVDEHVWRHTRWGNRYVTMVIDLTPVADGTGPARLLDMVPGHSKQTFITWLEAQTTAFGKTVEIVALVGQAVDKARQTVSHRTTTGPPRRRV